MLWVGHFVITWNLTLFGWYQSTVCQAQIGCNIAKQAVLSQSFSLARKFPVGVFARPEQPPCQ